MDGLSGPGVGSVMIFVHEGGVGMMMFGVGVEGFRVDAGVAAQAERIRDRNNKEENLRMFDSVCGASHPRYLIAC